MKKLFLTLIIALTVLVPGINTALAEDSGMTLTKPPIIPEGSSTATGTTPVPTIKLPGVGKDQGQLLQQSVIPEITNIVVGLTGGLALLFVIISGIQILTAYGNEEKIAAGKKTLTWALLGLLISILSYAIVQIIVSIKFV